MYWNIEQFVKDVRTTVQSYNAAPSLCLGTPVPRQKPAGVIKFWDPYAIRSTQELSCSSGILCRLANLASRVAARSWRFRSWRFRSRSALRHRVYVIPVLLGIYKEFVANCASSTAYTKQPPELPKSTKGRCTELMIAGEQTIAYISSMHARFDFNFGRSKLLLKSAGPAITKLQYLYTKRKSYAHFQFFPYKFQLNESARLESIRTITVSAWRETTGTHNGLSWYFIALYNMYKTRYNLLNL